MSPVFHRRAGIASGVVVALAAASLTFFAVQSKGETVHEADLNDGGVWVSATNHAQFARMNKAAKQFDAGVQANVTPGSGLDVLQDGSAVLGVSLATNQLVRCPRGTLLTGGGTSLIGEPEIPATAPVVYTNGPVGTLLPDELQTWGSEVANTSSQTFRYRQFALCLHVADS